MYVNSHCGVKRMRYKGERHRQAVRPSHEVISTWTTGAKSGIGTSFYNPASGPSRSNVWYTLAQGMLTEVYYPDVAHPQLQRLEFLVSDGKTFTDRESLDTKHRVRLLCEDALVYEQINTANNGAYEIRKTWITDPARHVVLADVTFRALRGRVQDYDVWLYVKPVLGGTCRDDSAAILEADSRTYLTAYDETTALALSASIPFAEATADFVGPADAWTVLHRDHQLISTSTEARQGNVALLGRLHLENERCASVRFTVALGLGKEGNSAVKAVAEALSQPFDDIRSVYESGWKTYVATLRRPNLACKAQYYAAAMTIRAHEDKLTPGAIVASLSIPWGDHVAADTPDVGGYHLVWARDLCQIASALAAIGDVDTAHRVLQYLDDVQQKPDGSFPQNTWPDGRVYWNGIQLDEAAFPILLAYQLRTGHRYRSLVKPAADFLLALGPRTDQDRWEENAGYSPSTLATQIAALVVAAEMARDAGDHASAARYLRTADDWFAKLPAWTVANAGPWSPHPYFIRVNDTDSTDDGHWIELKNGGGWHDKTEIVDAGFLELVRLGLMAADHPLIVQSLNVVDDALRYDSVHGPIWRRYNFDGYGEYEDGRPYNGSGVGRPWPLLSGERGEYEVAWWLSERRRRPRHVYGPLKLLQTLGACANEGRMIPEQIWDGAPLLDKHLVPDRGTGCATPLVWALAQYLRLAMCIEQAAVVEQPAVVHDRYVRNGWPSRLPLEAAPGPARSTASGPVLCIQGRTVPRATVVVTHAQQQVCGLADDAGLFTVDLPVRFAGRHHVEVIAYDNQRTIGTASLTAVYDPPALLHRTNEMDGQPVQYPSSGAFSPGDFELRQLRMSADDARVYFDLTLGHLDNPWGGPSGISKQVIDIYIDRDGRPHSGQAWTKDLNARFAPHCWWEKLIRITGNWHGDCGVYNSDWSCCGAVDVWADYAANTIHVSVPRRYLGSPKPGWGVMALLAGEQFGRIRPVRPASDEWSFGNRALGSAAPQFVDLLLPDQMSRTSAFQAALGLPMLRIG